MLAFPRYSPRVPLPGPDALADPDPGFLLAAREAALACGVTRLGDVTGLDRVGLPTWQAVRPAGRALSVHQGKGLSAAAAATGALCEAIENFAAEHVAADGPACAFSELPERARAPDFTDYFRWRRDARPDKALRWCEARNLADGARLFLPHALVSLDYRRGLPSRFDRSSNGLGAGPDETFALRAALLETIERDAVGEWLRSAPSRRAMTAIAVDGAPAWLGAWRDRLQAIGASLEIFACPSVTATPVLLCMVTAREEFGNAPRRFYGSGARGNPELALFAALAEALQSRLTLIAGARDDILPSHYRARAAVPEAAGPGRGRRDWAEIEGSGDEPAFLADRLRLAGYSQVAVKRLDAPPGVVVTKAFVPGLGSSSRPRRRVVAA